MTFEVTCGHCQKRYQVKDELAGKRVKCKCGSLMIVPEATTASEDPLGLGDTSLPGPLDDLLGAELPASDTGVLPAVTPSPTVPSATAAPTKKKGKRAQKSHKQEGMSTPMTFLVVAGFVVAVLSIMGIALFLASALKTTGFDSPEAAFTAHQQALHDKQWGELILTYTPANQKDLAFAVAYLAAEKYPRSNEVKQALEANGLMASLNPDSLPEREVAFQAFNVSDVAGCFDDMVQAFDEAAQDRITNSVLRAMQRKAKGERIRERAGGSLRDLKTAGDKATGTVFLVIEDDEEIEDTVTFRQIDGRWFIELDKDELYSHYFLGMAPLF